MKTPKITCFSLLLAALLLSNLVQAQIELGKYDENNHYSIIKVYTPPPLQIARQQLINNLNKLTKHITAGSMAYKGLTIADDRVQTSYGTLFFYENIIADRNIMLFTTFSEKSWGVSIPVSKIQIKSDNFYNSVHCYFNKREYAQDFAENVYYLLQPYIDKQLAEQRKIKQHNDSVTKADSIQFNIAVAKYRELKEKPTITEEQRKYIVQANSFAKDKAYGSAIGAYQKVIAANPVAYPAAYYNMALLYAETKDYKLAVRNMKKYLLLVPDAPDARAAQDKIYEWER